ncbi:MAG: serine/threonine protein kinase [Deltaproteobacteria bacterium]|nr:serine/threonine protein kinase [Deltaproteobacteria bacterium]
MSLKKFEILEMIAKGGMAEVYKAKTTGLQGFEKEVCVKKILPHLTEDDSFVNMFVNEAKLAATLNYANVVQVHDLCVSAGGEYFIVMEYVNGKDLSDVIRAAQLAGREVPADIAVYIAREVCKGLFYAHSKTDPSGANLNIIHRDISPHNVLVSFMGEVKITDFGIAKASSIMNKTAVGILKGKYGYMSPEQARGQPLDHRSDIFNTGIVLYELLVGERCFAGSSDFSTLNLMRNAEVTPPTKINRSVPPEVEAIVLKALSKERGDRYQDALALEGALADWAKKANSVATATELARFMRELFAQAEEREKAGSTGVLALSSVVGPAPKSEAEVARHQINPLAGAEGRRPQGRGRPGGPGARQASRHQGRALAGRSPGRGPRPRGAGGGGGAADPGARARAGP